MAKNAYASSPREGRHAKNEQLIVTPFDPTATLSEESRERLRKLADLPDDEIDTDDIPELPAGTPYILNPYIPASTRLKKAS